jgi:hypothetical protein
MIRHVIHHHHHAWHLSNGLCRTPLTRRVVVVVELRKPNQPSSERQP